MATYPNPGLEAELAYRREVLTAIGRGTRTRSTPWLRRRRAEAAQRVPAQRVPAPAGAGRH
jgi:hypothetical protein